MWESRVLLVEDDESISRPLTAALSREGFAVTALATAEEAVDAFTDLDPAVVLLDLSLPGMSGFDACSVLRQRSKVPILMLTGRGAEADRVAGLELGADDYLVKPFSTRELVARIRALLRRRRPRRPVLVVGDLRLDAGRRDAWCGERLLELSRREFDLLAYLMERSPATVPREELMSEVWDRHWHGSTRTLDVHIAGLRKAVEEDPSLPRRIRSERGHGYAVRAP